MIVHAGLIALFDRGVWRGALIEGPSGAGKSDLALRAMAMGPWRLVADDRVRLFVSGAQLFGRAPAILAGKIEARGLGVIGQCWRGMAPIHLAVRCLGPGESPERAPEEAVARFLGVGVGRLALHARAPSAPILLTAAMRRLGGGGLIR